MVDESQITLVEAAKQATSALVSQHDAEVMLARAIEHGELHANVKRWATEQWEGRQLPGNINRLETFIDRSELARWLKGQV
jgi:hypothetical protein